MDVVKRFVAIGVVFVALVVALCLYRTSHREPDIFTPLKRYVKSDETEYWSTTMVVLAGYGSGHPRPVSIRTLEVEGSNPAEVVEVLKKRTGAGWSKPRISIKYFPASMPSWPIFETHKGAGVYMLDDSLDADVELDPKLSTFRITDVHVLSVPEEMWVRVQHFGKDPFIKSY